MRTKTKKAKGDDAFETRRQKVGRKKLAPATATRAEVHARTLHLATSTAMAQANAAAEGSSFQKGEHQRPDTVQALSFAELLVGAQHYKAANRASALTTIARLLALQEQKDLKLLEATDRLAGFVAIPVDRRSGAAAKGSSPAPHKQGLAGVSHLEKLKSFAAALEAMTDTDDDARRAALQCLRTILRHQWLSATQTQHTTKEIAAVQHLLATEQRGGTASSPPTQLTTIAEQERTKAVVQVVHVALTHALKAVRLSGIALMGLLLEYAPPGAVRHACRVVCQHQQSYVHTPHEEAAAAQHAVVGDAHLQRREEEWMLMLARRVSSLVMKTKYIPVLPELLMALWMDPCSSSSSTTVGMGSTGTWWCTDDWHHPLLVQGFFEEVLPQWSNAWNELQELRLGLFRQEEKLTSAIALGRAFAIVLNFLKQKQMMERAKASQVSASPTQASTAAHLFLSRNKQQLVKNLFIHKVPVTMEEVLRPQSSSSGNRGHTTNSSRLEFALVLAQVCAPLAGSDDGWRVLHHYFNGLFSKEMPQRADSRNSTLTQSHSTVTAIHLSADALLQALRLLAHTLHMFPRSVFHARSLASPQGSTTNCDSTATVTEKLITFAPGVLRVAVQHVANCANLRSPNPSEEATLMQALLVLADVVHCISEYPLPEDYKTNPRVRPVAVALQEAMMLVPRLLFTLRIQYRMVVPSNVVPTSGNDEEEEVEHHAALPPETTVEATGALQQHPALVNIVVTRFLQVLWFVASSGHPLLASPLLQKGHPHQHRPGTSCDTQDGSSSSSPVAFVDMMRRALLPLFGLSMGGEVVEGVLARCAPPTVDLARHVLFYFGGHSPLQPVLRRMPASSPAADPHHMENEEDGACGMEDLLLMLQPGICVGADAHEFAMEGAPTKGGRR